LSGENWSLRKKVSAGQKLSGLVVVALSTAVSGERDLFFAIFRRADDGFVLSYSRPGRERKTI